MSTTTIRLSEELKARIAKAAEREGVSAHGFILAAIEEKAALAERRADFHALAHQRYARFLESGQSVPWEEVREYLKARLAGAASKRPRPRKLDR